MKASNLFLTVVLSFLGLCGCQTTTSLLPGGTYVRKGTTDYIKVNGREMAIYMREVNYPFAEAKERECTYTLLNDGRIWLTLPGRSGEAVYGIGRFEYQWNSGEIRVTDPKTEERWQFVQGP